MSDTVVLCYHAVSRGWPAALAIAPEQLELQVRTLLGRGYQPTTFTNAVTAPQSRRALAVTFDDGYRSVLEFARPILQSLGVPATVFVPTGFIDRAEPLSWPGMERWAKSGHRDELTPVSWTDLAGLAAQGWEVGSHTCSHPRLTQLSDHALASELADSRARCEERIGRTCESLAYPYGDVDARVIAATRDAGYLAAAALTDSPVRGERVLCWPRVGAYRGDASWRFLLKVSRGVRMLHATSLWPVVKTRMLAHRR